MDEEVVQDLSRSLNEQAKKYYITQDEITSLHPTVNSMHDGKWGYDIYEAALVMVSERYEKYDLVDLVSAIITKYEMKLRGGQL